MKAILTIAAIVVATPVMAQTRTFQGGLAGNSSTGLHYELKQPDARMSYLRMTFPEGEGGKTVPVVIVGRFYPDSNLNTVEGLCVRTKAGRDCRLKDSWKTHMTVSREAEGVTIRFTGTTQMLEIMNTGSKSRSPYDSDFYYHDITGAFRLEPVKVPVFQ